MKTYEVICEGVVQRTLHIQADDPVTAAEEARREFASLTGAHKEAVAVVDIYKERGHPYQFDLWRE